MTLGSGIAAAALCAVPIAAMLIPDVAGGGLLAALLFAAFGFVALTMSQ